MRKPRVWLWSEDVDTPEGIPAVSQVWFRMESDRSGICIKTYACEAELWLSREMRAFANVGFQVIRGAYPGQPA